MKVIFVLLIITITMTFLSSCNNNSLQRAEFWSKKSHEASDSALYESRQAVRLSQADTTNYAIPDSIKQHLERAGYWFDQVELANDSLTYYLHKL